MFFIALIPFPRTRYTAFDCVSCGTSIASEEDGVSVNGHPMRGTYVNPMGVECEIISVLRAVNIELTGLRSEDHTWFEGYVWEPLTCGTCGEHVGWRYVSVDPHRRPEVFYGLLLTALRLQG